MHFVSDCVSYYRRNHGSHFEQHKTAFEEGAGDNNRAHEEDPEARHIGSPDMHAREKETSSHGSVRSHEIAQQV